MSFMLINLLQFLFYMTSDVTFSHMFLFLIYIVAQKIYSME